MKKYDCIIVGAGPGGLYNAIDLFQNGIRNICIIEKFGKNIHKPCAGLLTPKAYNQLLKIDIDAIKDINYCQMKDVYLYYKKQCLYPLDLKNKTDFHYLNSINGDRHDLDNYLRNKVEELGIKVYYNTNILDVDFLDNIVKTKTDSFNYKHLIFADGYNGYSKNFHSSKTKNFVIEAVVPNNKKVEPFTNLYFGITKEGYAWYGNTGENSNIGFSDIYKKDIDYTKLLSDFAATLNIKLELKDIKGTFFPTGPYEQKINYKNVFFIGDASGLVNPLTIEGIYYSFYEASVVTKSIKTCNYKIYTDMVKILSRKFNKYSKIFKIFYNKNILKYMFVRFGSKHSNFIGFSWNNYVLKGKYSLFKTVKEYIKQK